MSSSSTRRQQQERDNEYISNTQQQHEATIHSIDMTKDNIRRSIEEVRRETPRYSQTVTDFQNETADASVEIADNFLESQKEVINSMQYAWAPMAERIGQAAAHYWTTTGITPFFSPREMADIYARTVGAIAEAYVASTRMATNMMFAGMEASKASTNYARQNAKEVSRITSNTARNFAQAAKETVQVQEGEDEQRGREGGISAGGSSRRLGTGGGGGGAAAEGSTAGSFESKGGGAATTTTTRTTYTSEGTIGNSGTGTGSAATTGTTGGTVSLSDTVPGLTGKTGKKF
jgi:hypothetical protein